MTRRYNKQEQSLIEKMCKARKADDGFSQYGMELLYRCFEGEEVVIEQGEQDGEKVCLLSFTEQYEGTHDSEQISNILNRVYNATLLLKDLETDRLIYYLIPRNVQPITKIVVKNVDKTLNTCELPDPKVSEIITKEIFGKSRVTETLFTLCKRQFKTEEDLMLEEANKQTACAMESLKEARLQTFKAEETLKKSFYSIIIAFLTLIVSIVALIISICKGC